MSVAIVVLVVVVVALALLIALQSFHTIGPTEVGLVQKRFSFKKLPNDNPIALRGEAGFQAELLTPGLRFKLWPVFGVKKYPWVQVPAGEIGVVIAQVGAPLPIGAKSAEYKAEFGNFSSLERFIAGGGQKGVQRPVLDARHVVADPSRRVPRRHVAQGLRPSRVAGGVGARQGDGRVVAPGVVRPHARATASRRHRAASVRRT